MFVVLVVKSKVWCTYFVGRQYPWYCLLFRIFKNNIWAVSWNLVSVLLSLCSLFFCSRVTSCTSSVLWEGMFCTGSGLFIYFIFLMCR